MAGDIKREKDSKAKSPCKPSVVDMVHKKEHDHSNPSLGQVEVSNCISKESNLGQELPADKEKHCPTTNCFEYYYPGYGSTFGEWDNVGYSVNGNDHNMSYLENPLDGSSVVYYVPGYDTYAPGLVMPPGGQYFSQPPYCLTTVYSQPFSSPTIPYGTDRLQAFSQDSVPLVGENLMAPTGFGNPKTNKSDGASEHSKASNIKKPSSIPNVKAKSSSDDSSRISSSSASVPAPAVLSEPLKPSSKVPIPSDFQGAFIPRNYLPPGNFVPYPSQRKVGFLAQNGAKNFIPNSWSWRSKDNLRTSGNSNLNESFVKMAKQNRGPRANRIKGSPTPEEISDKLSPAIRRDQYNLDLETDYDNALFFVIKSFSEDDVHKSIKYNVWASTPSGNGKLDAAFHHAEKESCEKGCRCPVFLFFSVNASGQFCGLAEVIGMVDFKKSLDFWQQDRWNGFFPVKWHIIKDIPNSQFRHIILKNNENKQVTRSRDMQEIEFLQGLEMLRIFKNYAAKSSILDDFGYYERREKLLMNNRNTSPTEQSRTDLQPVGEAGEKTNPLENADQHSLVRMTKNLSLSGSPDGVRIHPSRESRVNKEAGRR
ncbi:unnamed protein product [Victoria cruziana]